MNVITSAGARELEQRLRTEQGVSEEHLVGRAARGMATHLRELARAGGIAHPRAWIAAGKGHNGADGCALAVILRECGWRVDLWLAAEPDQLVPAASAWWRRAVAAGGVNAVKSAGTDWPPAGADVPLADFHVDALLGTGARGAPAGVIAAAIRCLNRHASGARVVAVDLPSGMDADTGAAADPCVRAGHTLAAGTAKPGFLCPPAWSHTGAITLVDIGLPAEWIAPAPEAHPGLITRAEVRAWLPARPREAHKGTFGHVLLIGGARGTGGAIALAARAAIRSGVGKVTVLTTAALAPVVAGACPEAMVHPAEEHEEGGISANVWGEWQRRLDNVDAIVAGPGMGNTADALHLVRRILSGFSRPILLDADALNCFTARAHWMDKSAGPLVITPHPAEAARLLGCTVPEIQQDRRRAVRRLRELTGAVAVLKGAGTLVQGSAPVPAINLAGNPGMATAGSGDVLAGLLGALLAQGLDPFHAACAAVHLHAFCGDLAACRDGEAGLHAGSLVDFLPAALRHAGE